MTKAEILEFFEDINFAYNDCSMYDGLSIMLDKLEQGLKTEALDKIRNDIMDTGAYEQEINGKTEFLKGINYCLGIIEKHKAESED